MGYYIMTADGWKPWLASFTPCPNSNDLQGVFQAKDLETVRTELRKTGRIERYLAANNIQNIASKQQYFRGHHYIEPICGAFGEKL